ncbi:hypothetical protein FQN50_007196 [Emmonsiellopsis sp. PD_5]|nr:hypothetical protein FQN50_007196 [Emmonsiellopsis sp. PD_5]
MMRMSPELENGGIGNALTASCSKRPYDQPSNDGNPLATKLIQEIASYVPNDRDLCSMVRAHEYFAQTIIPPGSGVWKNRFMARYDPPPRYRTSEEVKFEYKTRSIILDRAPSFQSGERVKERLWLQVLTTLLAEAYTTKPYQQADGPLWTPRNDACIKAAIMESDFLNRPVVGDGSDFSVTPSRPFLSAQIATTYLALDLRLEFRSLRTDYDLSVVYGFAAPPPLISDGDIDLFQLLHIRNFWKRHLTSPGEDTFYAVYSNILERQRPKACWGGNCDNGHIEPFWLGFYSCIHPLPRTLSELQERQTCGDLSTHLSRNDIQRLTLLPTPPTTTTNATTWPPLFNSALPISPTTPATSRLYFHGTQSPCTQPNPPPPTTTTTTTIQERILGFTEPLPSQSSIPGWRRIRFIIYTVNTESVLAETYNTNTVNGDGDGDGNVDDDVNREEWFPSTWATDYFLLADGYEGVVLPGGGIMMGRWVDLISTGVEGEVGMGVGMETGVRPDMGPFIFWAG